MSTNNEIPTFRNGESDGVRSQLYHIIEYIYIYILFSYIDVRKASLDSLFLENGVVIITQDIDKVYKKM